MNSRPPHLLLLACAAVLSTGAGAAEPQLPILAGPAQTSQPPAMRKGLGFASRPRLQYFRALFPDGPDVDSPRADIRLSGLEQRLSAKALGDELRELETAYARNARSIVASLQEEAGTGLPAAMPATLNANIVVIDSADPVAAALPDGEIAISPKALRGFFAGSIEEALNGQSGHSRQFLAVTRWPSFVDEPLSDAWYSRIRRLGGLLETLEPYTVEERDSDRLAQTRIASLNRAAAADPHYFDRLYDEVTSGQRSLTPLESDGLSGMMFDVDLFLVQPAEKFLLAHELGHIALGHKRSAEDSCSTIRKREVDADAFAVALLVYDQGMVDASSFARDGAYNTPSDFVDSRQFTLTPIRDKYGFVHAIKYGMNEAGMDRFGTASCHPASGEEREARTTEVWRKLLVRRLAAVQQVVVHESQMHPLLLKHGSATRLTPSEEHALKEGGRGRCPSSKIILETESGPSMSDLSPCRYYVRCAIAAPVPSADILVIAGDFMRQFDLHVSGGLAFCPMPPHKR